MAIWYVAPDTAVKTGLTFANIGDTGYGHAWNKAVRWGDFKTAAGAWANRANGDTFYFLSCDKPYRISNGAGWVGLVNGVTGLKFSGVTIDLRPAPVQFIGTRDWPWPKAGNTAAYDGETFMTITVAGAAPTFSYCGFKSMKYTVLLNATAADDVGLHTFDNCVTVNVAGGLVYTAARTDGRMAVKINRSRCHGYALGNARMWAANVALAADYSDSFFDAEHQNDNPNFNNASTPSALNVKDSLPQYQTVKTPVKVKRCVFINHLAGYQGSGYPQGDGMISEENISTVTVSDVVTWGNGDRGIDLKCAGTLFRHISLGDSGYAMGHHLDTYPIILVQPLYYAGARLTTSTTPPSVGLIQSSGWTKSFLGYLACLPTATQAAFASYGVAVGSVDPAKWQSSIYGGIHQGKIEQTDCYVFYDSTAGAGETQGMSGASNNGRIVGAFGLTASTVYGFTVTGYDAQGTDGTASGSVAYTTAADPGGERVAPAAAPTGFTVTPLSGGVSATFAWTNPAEDSGTSYQTAIVFIDFGDGAGYVPVFPGKSTSPLTLSGFLPSTAYNAKIAMIDANGNVGTLSGVQAFTTLSGSTAAAVPSAPLNLAVDGGFIALHPTAVGLGKAGTGPSTGFDAPATGTAAGYKIKSGATVVARSLTVPTAGSTPTLTKTNVLVKTR